jgi:hypothetical protein
VTQTVTRLNDHRTLDTFCSGRDEEIPFVGFRLNLTGDMTGQIEHRMGIKELDLFIRRLREAKRSVVEFEAMRGKKRAA